MPSTQSTTGSPDIHTDILIVGGGTGGCAAAMSATSMGMHVIMTEPTDWIGGQLTSQTVPPDEHSWIERFGCTGRFRAYRNGVRKYYRDNYPLTDAARSDPYLNPGNGYVSRLCHEPRVALAVLEQMLAFSRTSGLLDVRLRHKPVAADAQGNQVRSVTLLDMDSGKEITIGADYILDATETGDLLPMAGVEYVSGFESQAETGEPNAREGDAEPDNVQALSWVMAIGHDPDGEHVIDKPSQYERWRDFEPDLTPSWEGRLLRWSRGRAEGDRKWQDTYVLFPEESVMEDRRDSLWHWRRIAYKGYYAPGVLEHEKTLVVWPQNDYFVSNIIDKPEKEAARYLEESRQLSLSFLYWMQTEADRPDGGIGYPGLYLCPDVTGTDDGLAKAPYIRESRRIRAELTVTQNHIDAELRDSAEIFPDTVGIGNYHIDVHVSSGGTSIIDRPAHPFQIPLGALIPQLMDNLLPAGKNIGTTHISNGSYRLHPVEWNIGESVGLLAAYCARNNKTPRQVRHKPDLLLEFQDLCIAQGIELEWPKVTSENRNAAFDQRILGTLPRGATP